MIEIINNLNILNYLEKEKKNIGKKLIYLLFKEIPNLFVFSFNVESEYNDNNYYNNIILDSINGINLDPHSGEYYTDEHGNVVSSYDEEEASVVHLSHLLSGDESRIVYQVVSMVGENYDYGNHEIKREDFYDDYENEWKFEQDSDWILIRNKIFIKDKVDEFKAKDPKLTLIYSSLGEKLTREQEECFKEDIKYAYYYAKYCLKGKLPKDIENYLRLNIFKKEYVSPDDKFYLELYNNFVSNNE